MAATTAAAPNEIDEFMNGALITWVRTILDISFFIFSLALFRGICFFVGSSLANLLSPDVCIQIHN